MKKRRKVILIGLGALLFVAVGLIIVEAQIDPYVEILSSEQSPDGTRVVSLRVHGDAFGFNQIASEWAISKDGRFLSGGARRLTGWPPSRDVTIEVPPYHAWKTGIGHRNGEAQPLESVGEPSLLQVWEDTRRYGHGTVYYYVSVGSRSMTPQVKWPEKTDLPDTLYSDESMRRRRNDRGN